MKLSVVSSVFVNYSIFDAAAAIADTGVEAVDLWCGRPHLYRQDHSLADLNRLRAFLAGRGLQIEGLLPAFYRYPHSLSSPNDIVRQDSIGYVCQCVETAVTLGARSVLLVPGRTLHGQDRQDAWQRMVDSVGQICRFTAQYDLWLGIEPANHLVTDLVNTSGDALRLIQEVNAPKLGAIMDTGHMHLTGETVPEIVHNLGDLLLQFHVNDNDGRRQQNHIPGEGSFDFKAFYAALQRANYRGVLSLELGWDYTQDPIPAVTEGIRRLRTLDG